MIKLFYNPKFNNVLLMGYLTMLSIGAWAYCYYQQLVLVYNDAMSYQNIARLVVDNQSPGLAQIGTVWLPLSHLLKLPLIWNEWAWHSGFAGSLISMASYICMVIGLYLIVNELTSNRLAGMIAALVAAFNLNALYLQSTPLTEPLYLALFVFGVYFLIRYLKTGNNKNLVPLAFNVALQMMTRYDGWFVAIIIAAVIFAYDMWVRKFTVKKAIAHMMLYAVPVAFAGLLWLGWNALMYGDPLYFATGPFSARAQQNVIEAQTGLATKGSLGMAVQTFSLAAAENVGWIMVNIALIGWLVYLRPWVRQGAGIRLTALGVLGSVISFNILSLYLGFSVINLPQLSWDLGSNPASSLFNVRYGLLALPFAAAGCGLLVARFRHAAVFVLIAVAIQATLMYRDQPITLRDGRYGSSAFVYHDISRELSTRVESDDDVLTSMYQFTPAAFASGLPLRQFIHEGVSTKWNGTLAAPQSEAEWILVSNNESRDMLHDTLVDDHHREFERYYRLVYEDRHAKLYQLKSDAAVVRQ